VRVFFVTLGFVAVSAGAALGASAATYPGVKPKPVFATPGKAAYCYTKVAGYEDTRAKLVCWTPNDGWWVSIEWNGRRPRTGVSDTFPQVVHGVTKLKGYKPAARVLEFGRHWRLSCDNPGNYATCKRSGVTAFTCASLRTGLTCRNAVGHGFWIGRFRGYRLF